MSNPVNISIKQKRPVVILTFLSQKQRRLLEDEYGVATIRKMMAGAAEEVDPSNEIIYIQLPPGKNDPIVPLVTAGEREGYYVAVFRRTKFLEKEGLVEYVFVRREEHFVDDSEVQAQVEIFKPSTAPRKSF